jgi:hypothetical protein
MVLMHQKMPSYTFTFLSPEKFQNRKERNRLRVLVSYVGDYLSELGFGEG